MLQMRSLMKKMMLILPVLSGVYWGSAGVLYVRLSPSVLIILLLYL